MYKIYFFIQFVAMVHSYIRTVGTVLNMGFNKKVPNSEVDLGLLQHQRQIALQYLLYQKALHLGCSSSPRSASGIDVL